MTTAGVFTWTPRSLQTGTYAFTVRVTDNGTPSLSDSRTFTVTIGKRPTRLVYGGASAGQYSDPVPLSATLTDNGGGALQGTVIANATVGFTVGSQSAGGSTNPSGVAGANLTLTQTAQTLSILSQFGGDALYSPSSDSDAFTINKESAATEYTGDFDLMTAGPTITTATVRLAAKLTEAEDGSPGDISKATATFKIYKFTAAEPTFVLRGVTVDSNGEAQLSYNLPADIYTVRVEVDGANGYWVANPVNDGMLNVTVPTNEARSSGGGWLPDPTSANGRARFAFSVSGTKSGQPKGNISFSYQGADGYTYVVKSNSWQGGYLQFSAEPGSSPAVYTGSKLKGSCTVQKIDPLTGMVVASLGGYSFEIFTRDGDLLNPRQSDSYSITVRSGTNAVFHQVGSPNALITLGGGNITNRAR